MEETVHAPRCIVTAFDGFGLKLVTSARGGWFDELHA
jgi:hypothetical protein